MWSGWMGQCRLCVHVCINYLFEHISLCVPCMSIGIYADCKSDIVLVPASEESPVKCHHVLPDLCEPGLGPLVRGSAGPCGNSVSLMVCPPKGPQLAAGAALAVLGLWSAWP